MTEVFGIRQVSTILRQLALEERIFVNSDVFAKRIANFRAAIDALDSESEPWLTDWLSDEHFKGAVLFAAAKTNWNHERLGQGNTHDRQMRAVIVARFNLWAHQVGVRLQQYEEGRRDVASVAGWRSELALFKEDPVRNA